MFAVEIYAAVRRFVFVEGRSRREAARVFGLSRDTIAKMCRYSGPPGYVRSKAPERPKLGPLVPVIDAILESDKTAPPKQRHTAKRIFERLRIEHGYAGGYKGVKDYVRIARTRSREAFVPLAHPPGHPLALPAWDQQEETEQSDSRTDRGRAIDTRVQSELVSSIVPRGTSLRWIVALTVWRSSLRLSAPFPLSSGTRFHPSTCDA